MKTKPKSAKQAMAKRTASEPLHVMLTPEQMERYRGAQRALSMSMRDFVVLALDAFCDQIASSDLIKPNIVDEAAEYYAAQQLDAGVGSGNPEMDSFKRMLLALSERVRRLEIRQATQLTLPSAHTPPR